MNRKEKNKIKFQKKIEVKKRRADLMKKLSVYYDESEMIQKDIIKVNKKKIKKYEDNKNIINKNVSNEECFVTHSEINKYMDDNIYIESDVIDNDIEKIFDKENSTQEDYVEEKIENILKEEYIKENRSQTVTDNIKHNVKVLKRKESIQKFRQNLPIFYEESEIVSLLRSHDIICIKGSTGSGKSTQIPQFIYENNLSEKRICITQPRRLAAISISNRINYEMNGKYSGYKIKYENNVKRNTKIKVVTEGILLREIMNDKNLDEYSVIIIDEAHERTANLEALIPLVEEMVNKRNNGEDKLKVIIMSATLTEFNQYPLFEIKEKPFQVKVSYEEKSNGNYISLAYNRILKLLKSQENTVKNILVFLASKKDIYTLNGMLSKENIKKYKILPLHSSLSDIEQKKVFLPEKKIILSTNIAETSITISDIDVVIDSGKAKYRVETDSIEYLVDFISKSSAEQRMGRTGRTCDGVCYRLYTGEEFENMCNETVPEILMCRNDGLYLFLKALKIKPENFPFKINVDFSKAKNFLTEIKAININGKLTKLGKNMVKYPILPRYSRILNLKNTPNILFLLCAVLDCEFDYKRKYVEDEKSEVISKLRIIIEYLENDNKDKFCEDRKIKKKRIEDVLKLSFQLIKINEGINLRKASEMKGINNEKDTISIHKNTIEIDDTKTNIKTSDSTLEVIESENEKSTNKKNITFKDIKYKIEDEEYLRKILFKIFSDNLAVKIGSEYFYKNKKITFSNDFITTEKYIVFEHLITSNKKTIVQNVTVIEESWFEYI
ncbi:Pre-mRNA splicing factor ATP-dependent RNA helicase [Spraguea lophii 42_110]|uniref:Pre-mRNA splicing factor ATP-dependent RNA helicase n=1 Tax=Spraguea lophii (strain 42_110) TaxID=1358809 RepID=S7W9V4_SPRLO|nr:Pre-mRNA splicing factor ATP-dependent RNA helicase [Spraguea lophii 42_110]